MNLEIAKAYVWYGGVISAIIGFIWITWQMIQKERGTVSEKYADSRRILEVVWGITMIPVSVILILISISEKGEGIKGILVSLLAGIVIPILLFSLDFHLSRRFKNVKLLALTSFISLPLAGLGLSMLFVGFSAFFYGIRAESIWISFIIGSAVSLFVLRIISTITLSSVCENSSGKIESVFFVIQAFLVGILMAGYHFPTGSTSAYLPLLLLMALYISLLISTIPFYLKPGKDTMTVLPSHLAVFLGIFIGLSLLLVLKMNLDEKYLYPIITGSITSCVLIIMLYGSASATKGVDLPTGVMGTLLILGGLWLSFRWAIGFGMTLFGAGLISVAAVLIPYKSFESSSAHDIDKPPVLSTSSGEPPITVGQDTLANLFLRGITLAGLVVIITGLFRILVQRSFMLTMGLDLSYTGNTLALFLGVITPLSFEGFNLTGGNIFRQPGKGDFRQATGLSIMSLIVSLLLIYIVGIIFGFEGVGAFILGLIISSLSGVYTFFARRKEKGFSHTSFSPLWIVIAAYAITLTKYSDIPIQLTRLTKQHILIGALLFVIINYFRARYKNYSLLKEEKDPIEATDTAE
jgi:hypothetical protein